MTGNMPLFVTGVLDFQVTLTSAAEEVTLVLHAPEFKPLDDTYVFYFLIFLMLE